MRIVLEPQTTLLDIQRAFQSEFPHLKLQWHQHAGDGSIPLRGHGLPEAWSLDTCQARLSSACLDVEPCMSMASLRRQMLEVTGLHCRVLRRHESLWLEITQSETLSLGHQNALGALSRSS